MKPDRDYAEEEAAWYGLDHPWPYHEAEYERDMTPGMDEFHASIDRVRRPSELDEAA